MDDYTDYDINIDATADNNSQATSVAPSAVPNTTSTPLEPVTPPTPPDSPTPVEPVKTETIQTPPASPTPTEPIKTETVLTPPTPTEPTKTETVQTPQASPASPAPTPTEAESVEPQLPEVLIDVKNVSMRFRSYNKRYDTLKELFVGIVHRRLKRRCITPLNDINFTIRRGEKVAIFGRNGAGKSTLLKIISGILTPSQGSVTLGGRITPLLQLGAGFDGNDTGYNNIFLNGAIMGYTKKELMSKVEEIIAFSELGDFIYMPVKNYSSGMAARLGFSIAMCMNPDIILIDEILGVGDGAFRKKCAKKFDELKNAGATMVIVTHSTSISTTCERAIWIKDSRIEMDDDINVVSKAYNDYLATL